MSVSISWTHFLILQTCKGFFCWIWMLICFRIFEFIIGNWFSIFWWVFEEKKFSSTLIFRLLWSCTEELDKICNLTIFVFLISLICRTHLLEYIYFPYQFGNLRMSTLWKIECFLTKAKTIAINRTNASKLFFESDLSILCVYM